VLFSVYVNFQLPGHSEDLTAVTFQIQDESHTLGNALRYIIMKKYALPLFSLSLIHSPNVEFCGYSIPHPSEPKLNLRIQTFGKRFFIPLSDSR
jgi:DNA-directed RNA polymerases I and III subunit RPAC2